MNPIHHVLKKDVYFSNRNDSFFEFKFLSFFYIFSILYLISLKKYATHFVRQTKSWNPEHICPAFCHINNDLVIWKTRAKMKWRKRNTGRKLWKKYRVNKKHSFLLFVNSFIYVLFFWAAVWLPDDHNVHCVYSIVDP